MIEKQWKAKCHRCDSLLAMRPADDWLDFEDVMTECGACGGITHPAGLPMLSFTVRR